MTVSSTTLRNDYAGNGVTTIFPYSFRILNASDVVVTKLPSGTFVPVTLTLNVDYTVSGVGNATGGSVTLTTAPATGDAITLTRATPVTQPTSIRNQGTFFADTHENVFDRQTLIDQDAREALGRAVQLSVTTNPASYSVKLPAPQTGQVVACGASGLTLSTVSTSSVVLPGSGRTTSTLTAYLANNYVYNVLDYNADPTGALDSTSAIQAADTAAQANGGVVAFPPGTYKIASNLTVNSPVQVMPGGLLSPAVSTTTTLAKHLMAGLYQIVTTGAGVLALTAQHELFPEWWGAKRDGVTNDAVAIQAAIDAAHTMNSGNGQIGCRVVLSTGTYLTNAQIVNREGIITEGRGRVATVIKAGASFPTSTAVVLLGHSSETLTFGSQLRQLSVDCGSITGSIGIESTKINEFSGLEFVQVSNYMSKGIYIHGAAAQNYFLRELICYASASASGTYYGLDIDGAGNALRGLDGITIDHLNAASSHTAGVRVNNAESFVLSRLHVENCTDGILIGDTGSCSSFEIRGVSGSTPITSIVRITAGQSFIVSAVDKISGATNTIVDTLRSVTITDAQAAPYLVGNGSNNPSVNLSDATGALSTFRALFAKDNLFVGAPGHNTGISRIKHGTTAAMTAGVVTVSDADVTANSRIVYARKTLGGTVGHVSITAQTAGVSFVLTSSSATETSTFNWWMFEP